MQTNRQIPKRTPPLLLSLLKPVGVQEAFRIKWNDMSDPTKGVDFLYLNEHENINLNKSGSVRTERVQTESGSTYSKITDIIGIDNDLGVENLKGSGAIAGETSEAYNKIFTLTYVSGRSVGIGAYLVRLGQRVIQKGPPILLTGFQALNKVLGRNVYTSNYQIGGTQIMFNNGVSHLTATDDLDGVSSILKWLAFVPAHSGDCLPVLHRRAVVPSEPARTPRTSNKGAMNSFLNPIRKLVLSNKQEPTLSPSFSFNFLDPVDREVTYSPPSGSEQYDSRLLITGRFGFAIFGSNKNSRRCWPIIQVRGGGVAIWVV